MSAMNAPGVETVESMGMSTGPVNSGKKTVVIRNIEPTISTMTGLVLLRAARAHASLPAQPDHLSAIHIPERHHGRS